MKATLFLCVNIFMINFIGTLQISVSPNVSDTNIEFAIKYLKNYGYIFLNESNMIADITHLSSENDLFEDGLITFQENYGLNVTGVLDKPTIKAMHSKRCGVSDSYNIGEYRLLDTQSGRYLKWGIHTLRWNFIAATYLQLKVAHHAFDIWSQHANLKFIYSKRYPNILISMVKLNHSMMGDPKRRNCTYSFDGEGQVLGHAFFPPTDNYTGLREVHLDADEYWDYTEDQLIDTSRASFLQVLTHEIGHALGIPHTHHLRNEAVMYPFYSPKKNLTKYDLSNDDIYAVQTLYGSKPSKSKQVMGTNNTTATTSTTTTPTTTTTATTTTTTMTPTTKTASVETSKIIPNLCMLNDTPAFLIVQDKLYIVYKQWFWLKHLNTKQFESPALISDWLEGLPRDFKEIDAIYQSPNGTINIFINNQIYRYTPELKLINVLDDLRLSKVNLQLQGAVNTNSGRTLIFYSKNIYREINECDFSEIKVGYIGNDFRTLPTTFKHVFRYTNGKLYFFTNGNYFEYDEFTNRVIKSKKFDLSLFDLEYYDQYILVIKNMVKYQKIGKRL